MDGETPTAATRVARPERVRVAGPQDRERLWDLLMLAAQENALFPINEDRVRRALEKILGREKAVAGIIDGTTALAGAACLDYGQMWYSNAWHVQDLAIFVHPDYRRGAQNKGHAKALLQFAIWWADQMGLPLFPGVLSTSRTEGKIKFYQRELGPMVGAVFLHWPVAGHG